MARHTDRSFPGEPDRICDTAAELVNVEDASKRWLLDIEFQTEPDGDILERVGEYAFRLRRERRHGEGQAGKYLITSVIINLTGPPQPDLLDMSDDSLEDGHRVAPKVITMREESADATLSRIERGELDLCLLPWIPLMQGAEDSDIINRWSALAETETEERFRAITLA